MQVSAHLSASEDGVYILSQQLLVLGLLSTLILLRTTEHNINTNALKCTRMLSRVCHAA